MNIRLHRYINLLISCTLSIECVYSVCQAQHTEYIAQQWEVSEGLPQSTVRCITQSKDGYLWIGTWNGLARFDGVRMMVYRPNSEPALESGNILFLYSDSHGALWIGTSPGGLVRYRNGRFERFDSTNGIAATAIHHMTEDRFGRMWFATERGVYSYDGKNFIHYTDGFVSQVLTFPGGDMLVGMVDSALCVQVNGNSFKTKERYHIGGYRVAIDTAGAVWYSVRERGLVQRKDGKELSDKRLRETPIKEVYILRNGEKWLVTQNNVRVLSGTALTTIGEVNGIRMTDITALFDDREGNVWIGKEGGGLIRLKRKTITTYAKKTGFPADLIMSGLETKTGRVLIGTWDQGLLKQSKESQSRFVKVPLLKSEPSVCTMLRTRENKIYIGTWGRGLFVMENDHVRPISRGMLNAAISVVSIAEDIHGGIWVGTAHNGIQYFKGSEEKVWNTASGLSSNSVKSVLAARNGDVWVSVDGHGVNRISNNTVTVYKKGSGLIDDFTNPIYEDSEGVVWIGTNHGLSRYKNGTFSHVMEAQGLFDETIKQIIEDDCGFFWIGSVHGIFRISKTDLNSAADGTNGKLQCLTIGKEDGMLNEEVGGGGTPRCWKTSDGKLWFATSQGVVVLDPRLVTSSPLPPSVMIEDVWIENRPVPMDGTITMQPGETKIELGYTAISFASPRKIRFKYFLQGFDKAWNDAGTARLARYTNLDPGEYKFRIAASNNAGVWNENDASLTIVILPPYYAAWWFRSLIVLAVAVIVSFIFYVRVKQLKRAQNRQEEFSKLLIQSQEEERKRIAMELHDSVGQKVLLIKNQLTANIRKEKEGGKANSLRKISDLTGEAIQEIRNISQNLRPPHLDQLGLTTAIETLAEKVQELSDIRFHIQLDTIDGLIPSEQEINFFRIIQEAFNNIIKHSHASEAFLTITKTDTMIHVEINDNGKGVTPQVVSSKAGLGLTGMRERARMVGAALTIDLSKSSGGSITIDYPLPQKVS
jgi:signal transduction histidine kinase/ligand-binding sensor domain-containing protein